MNSTMLVAQVPCAAGKFQLVERTLPEPGRGRVRLTVEACGVCHSDAGMTGGHFPAGAFPMVPGHEVAGRIDAVGEGVLGWEPGDRAGVGWHGGHCGRCRQCRAGDFIECRELRIPGLGYDGGYAEAMIVPVEALARIPDGLTAAEAAPLMCAGVTSFNGLRRSGAVAGDLVAVLGVGGVGHMGVQFAAAMGFETVAVARGRAKEALARELGAHHYIDSEGQDVAKALAELGGASVVFATAADAAVMTAAFEGLAPRGRLVVIGASPEPIGVNPTQFLFGSRTVTGHASGTSLDIEDTLAFAARTGVRPMIETMPLEQAQQAHERMLSGQARFRVVLTPSR
ncbi:zinc-binding dehydrogenase [Wenjunlia tyrosinilytica]|jgi:alcohol dehydrogenase|uniref:Alcohol dehydrogenase n=1 Tax=Wenjunlia tyrosinilytica TaxID=1544741 RepID=A0A917ZN21_9ACTN|nr:zinc-binding dehydrogenase [Wenjunlia tyrosinilytica]GGO85422.1 alcohol dehydrogenase [Wenjunlia tyrosinilytica]